MFWTCKIVDCEDTLEKELGPSFICRALPAVQSFRRPLRNTSTRAMPPLPSISCFAWLPDWHDYIFESIDQSRDIDDPAICLRSIFAHILWYPPPVVHSAAWEIMQASRSHAVLLGQPPPIHPFVHLISFKKILEGLASTIDPKWQLPTHYPARPLTLALFSWSAYQVLRSL